MRIGFSARAWMLGIASGLVMLPAVESSAQSGTRYSSQRPATAPTKTSTNSKTVTATTDPEAARKIDSQLDALSARFGKPSTRKDQTAVFNGAVTTANATANKSLKDTGIRQVSGEMLADSREPARLIERPATRQAIETSRPARNGQAPSQVVPAAGETGEPKSEVQKQLEEMYRRDGRQMPAMELNQLPDSGLQQKVPPLPKHQQTAGSATSGSSNPFRRFFDRVTPFRGQSKKGTEERPNHVEAMTPAIKRQQQALQQQQFYPPQPQAPAAPAAGLSAPAVQAPAGLPQSAVALPLPAPTKSTLAPAATAPRELPADVGALRPTLPEVVRPTLPEFEPAVELPRDIGTVPVRAPALPIPAAPAVESASEPTAAPSVDELPMINELPDELIGEPATKSAESTDELDNPFPEMSEEEADGRKIGTTPKLPVDSPASEPKTEVKTPEPADVPAPKSEINSNPFTGLKLNAAPAGLSAEPTIPKVPVLEKKEPTVAEKSTVTEKPAVPVTAEPPLLPLPPIGKKTEVTPPPVAEKSVEPETKTVKMPLLPEPASIRPAQSTELPEIKPAEHSPKADISAKMKKIAERAELKGLKGFCPVALKDSRDLIDARPQFHKEFEGRVYNFSSAEALAKFESDPASYAPVAACHDVVLASEKSDVEGSLDHAVWFKDHLYLFSSTETMRQFTAEPSKYAKH